MDQNKQIEMPQQGTPAKAQRRQVQRSSTGCWTCKKRKKKCDETYPLCQRCIKAKITCFGYGDRPAWFERKSNSKSKKNANSNGAASAGGPGSSSSSTVGLHTASSAFPYSFLDHNYQSNGEISKASKLKEHEAQLLLYYLEYIFPLQWQYYTGNNSWLFPLLRQSRALYQSVLSVAATHMAIQNTSYDEELQIQHQLTLQELRNSINPAASNVIENPAHAVEIKLEADNFSSIDPSITGEIVANDSASAAAVATAATAVAAVNTDTTGNQPPTTSSIVQSLASIVMLISFELFQGGFQNWQQHIDTGSSLLSILTTDGTVEPQTDSEKFLTSAMVWMELIAIATTGVPCNSSSYLDKLIESSNFLPLENIMGCQTKVLIQLNEVAKLNAFKMSRIEEFKYNRPIAPLSTGDVALDNSNHQVGTTGDAATALFVSELSEKTELIKKQLEFALNDPILTENDLIENTTILYALAILVYLYGVTAGYSPDLLEISNAVERGIIVLDKIPSKYYRSLVFPITILGSMAKSHFHDYFDGIFGQDPIHLAFGNISQARKIMKHTWILRNTINAGDYEGVRTEVNWTDSMKDLNTLVLLV